MSIQHCLEILFVVYFNFSIFFLYFGTSFLKYNYNLSYFSLKNYRR